MYFTLGHEESYNPPPEYLMADEEVLFVDINVKTD